MTDAPYGDWLCRTCGHMVDTPQHELGCAADVAVHCGGCGAELPPVRDTPGGLVNVLHNGLCADCRQKMRRPHRQILAENDRLKAELAELREGLREEFIVCHAAGYPDPHSPWPNTLDNAQRFAAEHSIGASTGKPFHPVVKRRLVSAWTDVTSAR